MKDRRSEAVALVSGGGRRPTVATTMPPLSPHPRSYLATTSLGRQVGTSGCMATTPHPFPERDGTREGEGYPDPAPGRDQDALGAHRPSPSPLAADLAEWRPEECPRTYAHVFEEFDPAERMPAEEAIRAARVPVSSLDTQARMSQ